MFECGDVTHARAPARLPSYTLTIEPFAQGELIKGYTAITDIKRPVAS